MWVARRCLPRAPEHPPSDGGRASAIGHLRQERRPIPRVDDKLRDKFDRLQPTAGNTMVVEVPRSRCVERPRHPSSDVRIANRNQADTKRPGPSEVTSRVAVGEERAA
ncbi:MAG: hypothetical protein A2Z32_08595 [Chloroflexi bacterium RBG_16_69_14]|nr:MAG: hypothetical protein A2Z32_08595 [Chloroflexi bacterium RBG_16_69_14]